MSWALAVQEGAVNLIFVAVFSANGALTVLGPNLTEVALPRLVPVISITVPAAVGPWVGVIEVTAGAETPAELSAAVLADSPPAVVTRMSWTPAVQEGAVDLIFVAVFSADGGVSPPGP